MRLRGGGDALWAVGVVIVPRATPAATTAATQPSAKAEERAQSLVGAVCMEMLTTIKSGGSWTGAPLMHRAYVCWADREAAQHSRQVARAAEKVKEVEITPGEASARWEAARVALVAAITGSELPGLSVT